MWLLAEGEVIQSGNASLNIRPRSQYGSQSLIGNFFVAKQLDPKGRSKRQRLRRRSVLVGPGTETHSRSVSFAAPNGIQKLDQQVLVDSFTATSRSGSPSSRLAYLYNRSTEHDSPRPRRTSSGIPRSSQGKLDSSQLHVSYLRSKHLPQRNICGRNSNKTQFL